MPCFAAQETYSSGYFYYILEDESVSITGYFGPETETTVPSSIVGYPVSKICKGAFKDNKRLKTIHLPDTIMTIEAGSFSSDQKVIHDRGGSSSGSDTSAGGNTTETYEGTSADTGSGQKQTNSGNNSGGKSSEPLEEVTGSNGINGTEDNSNKKKTKDVNGNTSKGNGISVNNSANNNTNKNGTIEPVDPEESLPSDELEDKFDENSFNEDDSDKPSHGWKQTAGWILLAILAPVLIGGVIWYFVQKGRDSEC